jgi:hypothetical protein
MPPLSVWVDEKGWLGTQQQSTPAEQSVRLAAVFPGPQTAGMAVGVVGFAAATVGVYAAADTSSGTAQAIEFAATPLPTTTTTTPPTTVPPSTVPGDTLPDGPLIDPGDFGTERPTSVLGGVLFDLLTGQGVPPNQANCAIETLDDRVGLDAVDTGAVLAGDAAAIAPINQAALDCGIDQATFDATLAAAAGG